jgi:hypothetical protein
LRLRAVYLSEHFEEYWPFHVDKAPLSVCEVAEARCQKVAAPKKIPAEALLPR